MVKTLWENYEELHPIHSWLATWSPELMFDPMRLFLIIPALLKFFQTREYGTMKRKRIKLN
jgi:hypothetical protein